MVVTLKHNVPEALKQVPTGFSWMSFFISGVVCLLRCVIILIIVISISNQLFAKTKYDIIETKGKVKEKFEIFNYVYYEFDELIKKANKTNNFRYVYDSENRLCKIIAYKLHFEMRSDTAEIISNSTIYVYNSKGNLTSQTQYISEKDWPNPPPSKIYIYKYNSDNKIIKESQYSLGGASIYSISYKYNSKGQIISSSDSESFIQRYKNNKLVLDAFLDYKDKITLYQINLYKYQSDKKIEQYTFNFNPRDVYYWVIKRGFKYDKIGNLMEEVIYKTRILNNLGLYEQHIDEILKFEIKNDKLEIEELIEYKYLYEK